MFLFFENIETTFTYICRCISIHYINLLCVRVREKVVFCLSVCILEKYEKIDSYIVRYFKIVL